MRELQEWVWRRICSSLLRHSTTRIVPHNASLERLAQATTNKGYLPASPLQARVRWRVNSDNFHNLFSAPTQLELQSCRDSRPTICSAPPSPSRPTSVGLLGTCCNQRIRNRPRRSKYIPATENRTNFSSQATSELRYVRRNAET